jgi:hypothetical protein
MQGLGCPIILALLVGYLGAGAAIRWRVRGRLRAEVPAGANRVDVLEWPRHHDWS